MTNWPGSIFLAARGASTCKSTVFGAISLRERIGNIDSRLPKLFIRSREQRPPAPPGPGWIRNDPQDMNHERLIPFPGRSHENACLGPYHPAVRSLEDEKEWVNGMAVPNQGPETAMSVAEEIMEAVLPEKHLVAVLADHIFRLGPDECSSHRVAQDDAVLAVYGKDSLAFFLPDAKEAF